MIIVALGLIMDRPFPRPYHMTDKDVRPRRELSLLMGRLARSQAIRHRQSWRVREIHRRSDRAPQSPYDGSPLRVA